MKHNYSREEIERAIQVIRDSYNLDTVDKLNTKQQGMENALLSIENLLGL